MLRSTSQVKPIVTCKPPISLWIDSEDALNEIDRLLSSKKISPLEADTLKQFHDNGFVIFKSAISDAAIDELLNELKIIYLDKEKYLIRLNIKTVAHPESALLPSGSRLLDFYVPSQLASDMVLAPIITRFLNLLYGEAPLAFQSLLFTWGSQQSIHKDTSFVVVDPPCTLTASWIALEDVQRGQGELIYYPGSHRDPLFLFSEQYLPWNPSRDGKGVHKKYTAFLHQQADEKETQTQAFYAKKGDVLIWHPNLAHGGAIVDLKDKTRYSLVTHYCPQSANPAYFSFFDKAHKRPWKDGFYASRRYDMREGANHTLPVFFK